MYNSAYFFPNGKNRIMIPSMTQGEIIRFLILRTIGNFLLLGSLLAVFTLFGQAFYQEGLYHINQLQGIKYVLAEEKKATDSATPAQNEPPKSNFATSETNVIPIEPVDTNFGVVIPKINANAPIIANVDPSNHDAYMDALRHGVAHAAGSVFPGMDGNVYLFAHSTDFIWNVSRFNAVFYLLKELKPGDEIDVFFQGRRYVYVVTDTKITNPDDLSYITNNIGGGQRLTLQTCWPPGTSIKRLLVLAKPKSDVAQGVPITTSN